MSGEHAPLPPSGAPQWGHCSGAAIAAASAPDLPSEASLRGEAGHWVGENCLRRWQDPNGGCPTCHEWVGLLSPGGVVIDEEIAEGAQVFVDDVLTVAQEHGALRDMLIEFRVHMPNVHPTDNWGTLDCALVLMRVGLIYIWDYKGGHRQHTATGNLQLVDYLEGLRAAYDINGMADQHVEVIARIVQPFSYRPEGPIDEWRFTLCDLRGYVNQLAAKAHQASTTPTLSSGPWCRDCPAIRLCSAARKAGYNLIDYANEPYAMDNMTGADLATERRILRAGMVATKARLEAIEADLEYRVANGATDTGLALQSKTGNLAWNVPAANAIALAAQFGGDISKPGVMTPTQAKAAVPRELRQQFEQVLTTVTGRPSGRLQLTDADNTVGARAFKRK